MYTITNAIPRLKWTFGGGRTRHRCDENENKNNRHSGLVRKKENWSEEKFCVKMNSTDGSTFIMVHGMLNGSVSVCICVSVRLCIVPTRVVYGK